MSTTHKQGWSGPLISMWSWRSATWPWCNAWCGYVMQCNSTCPLWTRLNVKFCPFHRVEVVRQVKADNIQLKWVNQLFVYILTFTSSPKGRLLPSTSAGRVVARCSCVLARCGRRMTTHTHADSHEHIHHHTCLMFVFSYWKVNTRSTKNILGQILSQVL